MRKRVCEQMKTLLPTSLYPEAAIAVGDCDKRSLVEVRKVPHLSDAPANESEKLVGKRKLCFSHGIL